MPESRNTLFMSLAVSFCIAASVSSDVSASTPRFTEKLVETPAGHVATPLFLSEAPYVDFSSRFLPTDVNRLLALDRRWLLPRSITVSFEARKPDVVPLSVSHLHMLQQMLADSPAGIEFIELTEGAPVPASVLSAPVVDPDAVDLFQLTGPGFHGHTGERVGRRPYEEEIAPTVTALFQPLQMLQATGTSSDPPELPEGTHMHSLDCPVDQAARYAASQIPKYYGTLGYGICRPPRNTHQFYSHPLYYEDPNLERCGQSNGCLTTTCSAIRFASQVALTPYLMSIDHPDSCVESLPDCPTCHRFDCDATCPPWSFKAAVVQGAAVTGRIFIIP